ncbi:tRNA (adenosine(37)-N6)-threonylcarbamoyltransferase complex ATPase subunit type 1 TsaE [Patescibacteria group bacterium]|nr:tRNA (adenosine(37)-N6)-threonylcarbamoyltransferase complex ATPase subunit type 1 TsaE [Patescibacteria group bacterium]
MKKENITSGPIQTKKLGEKFAKEILKKKSKKKAFVVGLEGELGGGKTTFLQGLAKGLGIKEKILSPTFVIMKKINGFYHIDCYRVERPKELLVLGFKEIISNPKNIIVIEWADRIRKIMPKDTLWIKFDFIDRRKRKITFRNFQLCDTIKK